ncbi:mucin-2 [Sabethes cyaneus]|uniref:mucin-2 n=1 Tax=Sabethes cyaneus TaxID=53552 RepID=UPI00237DB46C|nr:mucin-2 [Sabethes cyaneus]
MYMNGLIGILTLAVSRIEAIRVYWNTNTGPIQPPTSTPVPVPKPPFREPAPVWENQSGDVPNPNPYIYILPPPSRPKYNDITQEQRKQNRDVITAPTVEIIPVSSSTLAPTGKIIDKPDSARQVPVSNGSQPQNRSYSATSTTTAQPVSSTATAPLPQRVPSLAVQYVPNQGFKYYAVVPGHNEEPSGKSAYLKSNDAQLGKYDRFDKPNGRYNAKLKKYKAFEKVKYAPYYVLFDAQKQQYILTSVQQKAVNNHL